MWCVGRRGPGEPDAKPERRISEVGSGGATDRVRELARVQNTLFHTRVLNRATIYISNGLVLQVATSDMYWAL